MWNSSIIVEANYNQHFFPLLKCNYFYDLLNFSTHGIIKRFLFLFSIYILTLRLDILSAYSRVNSQNLERWNSEGVSKTSLKILMFINVMRWRTVNALFLASQMIKLSKSLEKQLFTQCRFDFLFRV